MAWRTTGITTVSVRLACGVSVMIDHCKAIEYACHRHRSYAPLILGIVVGGGGVGCLRLQVASALPPD